jgi:hypothetical protein
MLFVPILAGTCAFCVVSSIVGGIDHVPGAGLFPGAVAALWAAWPLWHFSSVARHKLLHPQPKLHAVNAQVAFSKIRDVLRETIYQYGDQWRVITADVATMRILADLRYVEEETQIEMGHRGELQSRTNKVQRCIRLETQICPQGSKSIVQFDFEPRVEGFHFTACDSIIKEFISSAEASIGTGTLTGSPAETRLSAPPWWLLGLTGLMIIGVMGDVGKELSAVAQRIENHSSELTQRQQEQDKSDQDKITEMAAWQKFKEANGLK